MKSGLFAQNNGIEVPLLYAAAAVSLALTGPGAYSLDARLALVWTPMMISAALVIGIAGALGTLSLRRPQITEAKEASAR